MVQKTAVVIGANGAIGKALVNQYLRLNYQVVAISSGKLNVAHPMLTKFITDYSRDNIQDLSNRIARIYPNTAYIAVCNGILHTENHMPEKKIEAFDEAYFNTLLQVNTMTPFLWLQAFMPHLLSTNTPCVFTALSARIGSISDNQLGGWYSYRASKAALNMLFKTASVELKRRRCNVKLMLFHPGTTDSALSKPFQNNVPQDKLFKPEFVAQQLHQLQTSRVFDGDVDYIDWQGESIEW
ncbi:SDR family NAD(P)-dependent oxidoreductase [Pseudoalteromonas sp. Of7M-16]|uniref:SDR family NAD(P)-dependent oxidoreductase n=1 Tax=Pseudoalteromonas sp. Of7M-16 TaxID=2917756 RepID=UPI001EF4FE50|nr:SDR family NAD(P)-dependent oxidoreductase [Pseudoalteromonas sp. Of7M-16]MCG7547989.1 SDR family NAD(P)-dependent oxidoreductase [Pseudoalteromonas sp. Of7M-16]